MMVAFSGATDADECSAWSGADPEKKYIKSLAAVYLRLGETVDAFKFKDSPTIGWSFASNYFSRSGEVLERGSLWKAGFGNWLHFAGEHPVGYMGSVSLRPPARSAAGHSGQRSPWMTLLLADRNDAVTG